jgi:hypothetical protein
MGVVAAVLSVTLKARESLTAIGRLAIVCQSSVFRCHLNGAVKLGGAATRGPLFHCLGDADWLAKAEDWQRKASAPLFDGSDEKAVGITRRTSQALNLAPTTRLVPEVRNEISAHRDCRDSCRRDGSGANCLDTA